MKKTNKKGFTIVELVIVIAVIAILAAVLVPNISRLVKKANESSDLSLVRNLNTALAVENTTYATAYEAFEAVKAAGYDLTKIEAKASDNKILFDSANQCFAYLDGSDLKYYPNSTKSDTKTPDHQLWAIVTDKDEAEKSTYSVYWNGEANADITVKGVGFDAGEKTVKSVTYTGATEAHTVTIRIANENSIVNIDARQDSVIVYGTIDVVNAKNVGDSSLYIKGAVSKVLIDTGRVVFDKDAETAVIIPVSNNAIIAFSETLEKDNYPFVQRVENVNSFKFQKVNAKGAKKAEVSVSYNNNDATTPTNVDGLSDSIIEALSTEVISSNLLSNIANGTSNDGLTGKTHNVVLNFEQLKYAAQAGGTYKLGADFTCLTEKTKIPAEKKFNLDLNGHKVDTASNSGKHLVIFENYGEMAITDSKGNGTLSGRSVVYNYGELTLSSGELLAVDNGGGASVWNYSNFVMTGGTLKSTGGANGTQDNSTSSSCLVNHSSTTKAKISGGNLNSAALVIDNKGELTIEGGENDWVSISGGTQHFQCVKNSHQAQIKYARIDANIGGCVQNDRGSMTIESCVLNQAGYYDHNSSCVATSNGGTTQIKGTTIDSLNEEKTAANGQNYCIYVFSTGGTITVEGGSFSGGKDVLRADKSTSNDESKIIVKNGFFNGTFSKGESKATIEIQGGTFSNDPTAYVDANTYSVNSKDETWTVTKK